MLNKLSGVRRDKRNGADRMGRGAGEVRGKERSGIEVRDVGLDGE